MSKTYDGVYHEKQVKELCALHALNNLFQKKQAFTKQELDEICQSLSPDVWINPHRSLLGLGNYDVNVIMTALQRRGCEAIWFDKRKDPSCLQLDRISGFILNVPSDYRLGFVLLPLRRKHWVAIRQVAGTYYNLDSKLDSPVLIGLHTHPASERSGIESRWNKYFLQYLPHLLLNGREKERRELEISIEQLLLVAMRFLKIRKQKKGPAPMLSSCTNYNGGPLMAHSRRRKMFSLVLCTVIRPRPTIQNLQQPKERPGIISLDDELRVSYSSFNLATATIFLNV
ncbi:Josephin-1 [Homalodisca vitripennis]|nr:Josephin-1 [Homalodisca vitripennis]